MKKSLISDAARAMNAQRKTRAGGRPRSKAERCPCEAMTLRRANAHGPSAEHEPFCSFFKAPKKR